MRLTPILMTGVLAGSASAAIVVDGTADGDYGSEITVQDTQTQFGDNPNADPTWADGSELDGGYASIQDGFLYIMLSGNLQSNYNKLEVFIDYKDGGQNKLRGDNQDVDFNGLNRMGDDGSDNGLRFDADFAADHWITMTCGDVGKGVFGLFASHAEILTDGGGTDGGFLGGGGAEEAGQIVAGNGIICAINNSNVAGVDGGMGPSDGSGVLTGMEIAIPMSLLGDPTGDIKVCAFINGGGHDFVSNQVLAPATGVGNLGEPRNVDFSLIAGDQFFVVPGAGGPPCPADINGDMNVNFTDVLSMLTAWGPCEDCPEDVNGDDQVNFNDVLAALTSWGPC